MLHWYKTGMKQQWLSYFLSSYIHSFNCLNYLWLPLSPSCIRRQDQALYLRLNEQRYNWGNKQWYCENIGLTQEGFWVLPKLVSLVKKRYAEEIFFNGEKAGFGEVRYKIDILKTTWGTVSCAESMFANDTIYLHQDRAVKLLRALSNLAKWATQ